MNPGQYEPASDPASAAAPRAAADPGTSTVVPGRGTAPDVHLGPPRAAAELGRLGPYRLLGVLGTGGMGRVYRAHDTRLDREVALKVLLPEVSADPKAKARFVREARAQAKVEHDHIIPIHEVEEAGGVAYIVMPLLKGQTLDAALKATPRPPLGEAVRIVREIAEGLAAAHAAGLIHRDIKPANVWLETDGPEGPVARARVLDFGLARRSNVETSITSTGFIVGTPNYMSPEQAAGEGFDHRTDLFSLGCVLYAALVGEMPFRGTSAMAVMMALASRTPAPVAERNPAVPRAVSDLVSKLIQKRPEDRVQTAAEVAGTLDALLARAPEPGLAPGSNPETLLLTTDTAVPGTPRPRPLAPPARRALTGFGLLLALAAAAWLAWPAAPPPGPIVVGVLHSQSGTMAVSENPVIDATLLAIDEVNAAGGLLGRPLRPVLLDGESNPEAFAKCAERLLSEDRAAVVFGCWTSASRKAARPVFERHGGLLFYPVQYEGLEGSPRIVYLGPAPNQQLIPAVDYAIDVLKKRRLALVGSDYVFPRTAHAIIRDHVRARRAAGADVEVVSEDLIPLGSTDVQRAVDRVRLSGADLVLNTINGSTNGPFFAALRDPAAGAPGAATISVSITENEVRGLNPPRLTDDYIVASYFQAVDRPESRAFVARVRAKYGADRTASDMMAAAYSGVHLWARAATAAKGTDPSAVLAAVRGLEFDGPGARVRVDPDNLHAWLPVRVGKVRPNGDVAVVGGSDEPVRPVPFPGTRTRAEWDHFLSDLQMRWGGRWQAPEK